MMEIDASIVAPMIGGATLALGLSLAASFFTFKAWRKHPMHSSWSKWLVVVFELTLLFFAVYGVMPLVAFSMIAAFPLMFLGCYAGRNLAR